MIRFKEIGLLFLLSFLSMSKSFAGATYVDLMDQAIYNTYGGSTGYFRQAACSVCHGNQPEDKVNATTDFASNFIFVGQSLLQGRGDLSNLTLAEMATIVNGMKDFDPDSDGWTNEQEWGWDRSTQTYLVPSNPNDYNSHPDSVPVPGGDGSGDGDVHQQSGLTDLFDMPQMGGCGMRAGRDPENRAEGLGWLFLGVPLAVALWRYRR